MARLMEGEGIRKNIIHHLNRFVVVLVALSIAGLAGADYDFEEITYDERQASSRTGPTTEV
jgi:hypothetical protein